MGTRGRKRNESSITGQIVLEYLQKYPKLAKKTLARKIYEENPELFTDVEHARNRVRYYTGALGGKMRKGLDGKHKGANYSDPKIWDKDNDYVEEEVYAPYTMPTGENNVLLLPDIHIPYHDPKALKTAIEYGKSEDVNTIILTGDQVDFYGISDFVKKPFKPSMKQEMDMCRQFLRDLRDEFPHARIYFKEGNHELRWYRYWMVKAPEFYDMMINELDDILQMTAVGITPIKDNRRMLLGDYSVLHGHEVKVSSMLYPAAALYRKTKVNSICGHLHRSDTYSAMDINKKRVVTHVMGCLCSLIPEFAQYNFWNHGFAHIKVSNGICSVNNIIMEDYKII